MSTIETALYNRLTGRAGLTALVGKRIFPVAAPEDIVRPFIVYSRISAVRTKNVQYGPSYTAQPRIQVDCYATTYEASKAIAEQVRLALDGWQDLGAAVPVKGSSLVADREFWESLVDPKLYRVSMDFMIIHDEASS